VNIEDDEEVMMRVKAVERYEKEGEMVIEEYANAKFKDISSKVHVDNLKLTEELSLLTS
jgi:hypothetical protein